MKIIKKYTEQVLNPNYKKGQKPHKKYLNVKKMEVVENPADLISFSSSYCEGQIEQLESQIDNLEKAVKLLLNSSKDKKVLEYIVDCLEANSRYRHDRPEYGIDYLHGLII